MIICDG